jgi:hypothetical protein
MRQQCLLLAPHNTSRVCEVRSTSAGILEILEYEAVALTACFNIGELVSDKKVSFSARSSVRERA